MWLFTKHGFYSAVCARQGDERYGQSVDPNWIMVRARVRKHLDALKERFAGLIGDCEIQEFSGSDYAFRIFVRKPVWSQVLVGLNEELDCDNLKSEFAHHQVKAGAAYEHSLHEVWSVMHRLQKSKGMVEEPPDLSHEDEDILDQVWNKIGKVPEPSLIHPLFDGPLDIIGDVHGEIDTLRSLLGHLGYKRDGKHTQGRRLVFVGDLTDRGPDSPAVVDLVASLIEAGQAQCVLGNHDLNFLLNHRKPENKWFWGEEFLDANGQIAPQVLADSATRQRVLALFRSLPIVLERDDLRVIHACWNDEMIGVAKEANDVVGLYDHHHELIEQSFTGLDLDEIDRGLEHQNRNPVKRLTSGPEERSDVPIHSGGKVRNERRVHWWNDYDGPLCVFGHYSISDGEPRGGNSAFCVDYGVGQRWKERRAGKISGFSFRLAALRYPERQVLFDDGEERAAWPPRDSEISQRRGRR